MSTPTALAQLRDSCPTLSVGILTADLMAVGSELFLLERAGVKVVHVDVMDGCFCPVMTVGPPFIKAMKTPLLKDVHLMIQDPLEKIDDYAAAGADILTIHPESGSHIHRTLQRMRTVTRAQDAAPVVRGLALNPGTPLDVLEPLLDEVDLILLLAVNPGWKGQQFIPSTFGRIARVKQMIAQTQKDILLAVDGGITRDNIAEVARTGVDLIVTGSAVFDGKAPEANARFMLSALASRTARAVLE